MARGGSRPGAGRPKGAANKRSQDIAAKAHAEGISPLEVMLMAMNRHIIADDLDKAHEKAKDAAPYMHPRLTAVEATGKGGEPLIPEGTSNRALAMAVLALLRGSAHDEDEQGRPDTGAAGDERAAETETAH